MTIHRTSKTGNFSIVDNGFANDPNLAWEAKGLMIYLLTKPDHWRVSKRSLIKCVKGCGEIRIESILKKLEKAKYLIKWQSRDSGGRIFYEYEVLEANSQYEQVLEALLSKYKNDKNFKITVGHFSAHGKPEDDESKKSENPLSVKKTKKTQNTESDFTVSRKPVGGKPVGGKPVGGKPVGGRVPPIVNTDQVNTDLEKTDLEKTDFKNSLSPKGSLSPIADEKQPNSRERETGASALLTAQQPTAQQPTAITTTATAPPRQNPTPERSHSSNGQTQYSAPRPPAHFLIERWEQFTPPGMVPEFWEFVLRRVSALPQKPGNPAAIALKWIRNTGDSCYRDYRKELDRKHNLAIQAATATLSTPQPPDDLSNSIAQIEVTLTVLGWSKKDAVEHMFAEGRWPDNLRPLVLPQGAIRATLSRLDDDRLTELQAELQQIQGAKHANHH